MGKQTINGDVEITGQLLKGDLKALYHLGAYDSVDTTNADYDVITRNGYYFDENSQWTYYADPNVYVISIAGVSSDTSNVVCNKSFAYRYSWDGTDSHWYFENGKYYLIVIPSDLQGIVIQAKNPSSYTERVLKNQPISKLDQAGENWLRGEYEKTLNLFNALPTTSYGGSITKSADVYTFTPSAVDGTTWKGFVDFMQSLPDGTYTIKVISSSTGDFIQFGAQRLQFNVPYTFTKSGTIANIGWIPASVSAASFEVMLNEGNTAQAFQPYNGEILHAIDVEGALLWLNGTPNASFSAQTISVPTIYDYPKIKLAFKANAGSDAGVMFLEVEVKYLKYFHIIEAINGTANIYTREFQFAENGVRILGGYYNSVTSDTPIIPIAIYGIK